MDVMARLVERGIQPTPQRIAVAEYVLATEEHPSADQVWERVRGACPTLSRATVYNTLNLFAARGLLHTQNVADGALVFDANVKPHHHFIDEETGSILDVPWEALKVSGTDRLRGYEVLQYQVVVRGRRKKARRP